MHRCLFKIDVEGYEKYVLKGIRRIIKESSDNIGLIEFNNNYLANADTDINEFSSFLAKNFPVYYLNKDQLIKFTTIDFHTVSSYFKKTISMSTSY